jgi:hypothetical protein
MLLASVESNEIPATELEAFTHLGRHDAVATVPTTAQ